MIFPCSQCHRTIFPLSSPPSFAGFATVVGGLSAPLIAAGTGATIGTVGAAVMDFDVGAALFLPLRRR